MSSGSCSSMGLKSARLAIAMSAMCHSKESHMLRAARQLAQVLQAPISSSFSRAKRS